MKPSSPVEFQGAIPNMLVTDLKVATEFYKELLGFSEKMSGPGFVVLTRDHVTVGLIRSENGAGTSWCYLAVSNPSQLFETYQQAGVTILQPLATWEDHSEFTVADPDQNRIDIGS